MTSVSVDLSFEMLKEDIDKEIKKISENAEISKDYSIDGDTSAAGNLITVAANEDSELIKGKFTIEVVRAETGPTVKDSISKLGTIYLSSEFRSVDEELIRKTIVENNDIPDGLEFEIEIDIHLNYQSTVTITNKNDLNDVKKIKFWKKEVKLRNEIDEDRWLYAEILEDLRSSVVDNVNDGVYRTGMYIPEEYIWRLYLK
ncbi:hypothetical protein [[Acholeplasma] multilocale]|uniref:hypothetical protein n=1 Tax=[Acholeplasma] multilocale TaxID=264638 RepID=UPI00047CC07F|nr:hypothetical protein [[Acholeplasma] multilocale]